MNKAGVKDGKMAVWAYILQIMLKLLHNNTLSFKVQLCVGTITALQECTYMKDQLYCVASWDFIRVVIGVSFLWLTSSVKVVTDY